MKILMQYLNVILLLVCSEALSDVRLFEYKYKLGESYKEQAPITLSVKEKEFIKDESRIDYCAKTIVKNIHASKLACRINGFVPFGLGSAQFEKIANSYISNITLQVGSESYILDSSGMFDAILPARFDESLRQKYKPNIEKLNNFSAICYDEYNCVIRGGFSDGCCAYFAEWTVINGSALRTMIFDPNKSIVNKADVGSIFSKPNRGLKLNLIE